MVLTRAASVMDAAWLTGGARGRRKRSAPPAYVGLTVALLLAAGPLARPAGAVAPPDSLQLAGLRKASDTFQVMRVQTRSARWEARRPGVDSAGVSIFVRDRRDALIVLADGRELRRRIAWPDIETIDGGYYSGSRALRTGAVGFLLGAAVGAGIVSMYGPDIAEKGDSGVVLLTLTLPVLGGLAGVLIGASNVNWQPIYP